MPFLYSILPPSQFIILSKPILYLSTGTSNTWFDTEGSNSFTMYNSPTVTNAIYTFNGTTQYAHISSFSPAFSSFSIMMWMKLAAINTNQFVFTMVRSPSNIVNEGIFNITSSNRINFWDFGTSTLAFSNLIVSNTSLTTGVWYCVGFVKNGVNGTYYLNGLADGTTTAAANITYGTTDYAIGKDIRDNGSFFRGQIGQVLLYNKALTSSEMLHNCNATKAKVT